MVLHNPDWETSRPKFEPRGTSATEIVHEKGWAKFDLLLGMSERANGLNTTWEYSTELFDDADGGAHMRAFRAAASRRRRRPRPADLASADAARGGAPRSSSRAGPGAPAEFPRDVRSRSCSRSRRSARPRRPPSSSRERDVSYRELDRRANRSPHACAISASARVVSSASRWTKSLDLVPAVLGVVKAGRRIRPARPDVPGDRIEFMLEDSRPAVMLTEPGLAPTRSTRSTTYASYSDIGPCSTAISDENRSRPCHRPMTSHT